MKFLTSLLMLVLLAVAAFAQAPAPTQTPQYVVVVPATQVVAPTPAPAPAPVAVEKTVVAKTSEWVDLGTNIGQSVGAAAKAVLHEAKDATFGKDVSVVQGIDNFSKTDAGRFTMLVIGWKVMGKDAIELLRKFTGVLIGIPIQIGLVALAVWITRRFWMVRSVVLTSEGPFYAKKKTFKLVNEDVNESDRYVGLFLTWAAFSVLSAVNVFSVIL